MEGADIEITAPIQIEGAIHFWIDRDEWASMSDDEKRAAIAEQIWAASSRASDDCFDYASGTISAEIGPISNEVDLDDISFYDPKRND